ncbi:MAG: RnfABCDGE type electron transport complex subunit B [Methanobacteriota archaeon]
MVNTILLSGGLLIALGLSFGYSLAYARKRFNVKIDERAKEVEEHLPGFNCAACGKTGCRALSEAIIEGSASHDACAPGGGAVAKKIAKVLGVEAEEKEPQVAIVKCGGGVRAKDKYEYRGVPSCAEAIVLAGGQKACSYGCLGFGDCVKACRFEAMTMGDDGLPKIDPEKCTACGLCVKACPKDLIELAPKSKRFHVLCKSKDKGAAVKGYCEAGCIGCGICVRNCPKEACIMEENLARIDYTKCDNTGKCAEVCPTKCIKEIEC